MDFCRYRAKPLLSSDFASTTQSATQTTWTEASNFTKNDKVVLALVHKRPDMTQKELAMELGWTVDGVKSTYSTSILPMVGLHFREFHLYLGQRRYNVNRDKIGKFIANQRKEQGMTQMQFAEKLGITNKAVSKWETGKCLPDAELFSDICLLLKCTLNELFAGEKIIQEKIEKTTEEKLVSRAAECRERKYDRSVIMKYIVALLMVICISINIKVGGIVKTRKVRLFRLFAVQWFWFHHQQPISWIFGISTVMWCLSLVIQVDCYSMD